MSGGPLADAMLNPMFIIDKVIAKLAPEFTVSFNTSGIPTEAMVDPNPYVIANANAKNTPAAAPRDKYKPPAIPIPQINVATLDPNLSKNHPVHGLPGITKKSS